MNVDMKTSNGSAEGILEDFKQSKPTVSQRDKELAENAIAQLEQARQREIESVDRGTQLLDERRQLVQEIHDKTNKNFLVQLELDQANYSQEQLEKLLAACSGFAEKVSAFQNYCAQDRDHLNQSLPSIVADSVEIQNNLAREHKPMNETIIAAIQQNMKRVQAEIAKTCAEFFIKRNEEVQKLTQREEEAKATVKVLKAKLRERTKPKPKAGPATWKASQQPDRGGGDFDSVVGNKRRPDEDEQSHTSETSSRKGGQQQENLAWRCEGCQKEFSDHDLYSYHVFRSCTEFDEVLIGKGLNPDDKEIDCPYCGNFFNNYTAITDHKSDEHKSISGQPLKPIPSSQRGRGTAKRSKKY